MISISKQVDPGKSPTMDNPYLRCRPTKIDLFMETLDFHWPIANTRDSILFFLRFPSGVISRRGTRGLMGRPR
jgi:hypothetical protein